MTYTAFHGLRRVASGSAAGLLRRLKNKPQGDVLVFDDTTGSQTDLDFRPHSPHSAPPHDKLPGDQLRADEPRGRGRPRLGVIAKEVTLLPRHWDWLSVQPGGASVALRRLVEEARKTRGDRDRVRTAQEAAYRFMSAIAANLPGFEEAARSLFAYDRRGFTQHIANWPEDVRDYAVQLAFADQEPPSD